MSARLPVTRKSTDYGFVYIAKRDDLFKIGFSRDHVARRVRECGGELILSIRIGVHPAKLERVLHHRFAEKRAEGPLFKREWFRLNDEDIT